MLDQAQVDRERELVERMQRENQGQVFMPNSKFEYLTYAILGWTHTLLKEVTKPLEEHEYDNDEKSKPSVLSDVPSRTCAGVFRFD